MEILEKIGSGSFGTVFKMKDRKTGQIFAVKEVELKNQDIRDSIMSEIDTMKELSNGNLCKNIVLFKSSKELNGKIFVVMEFVDYDLERMTEMWRRSKLTFEQEKLAKELLLQGIQTLEFIHSKGLIHQDIKLENVFFDPTNSSLKIGDFGLACRMNGEVCSDDDFGGSPTYMSPEMIKTAQASPWSDFYALGVTFFNLLNKSDYLEDEKTPYHQKLAKISYMTDHQWTSLYRRKITELKKRVKDKNLITVIMMLINPVGKQKQPQLLKNILKSD